MDRAGSQREAVEGLRTPDVLDDPDRAMLEFERLHRVQDGRKDQAISDEFHLSTVLYYDMLNTIIDSAAAVRYDPTLVRGLREERSRRVAARAARVFLPSR